MYFIHNLQTVLQNHHWLFPYIPKQSMNPLTVYSNRESPNPLAYMMCSRLTPVQFNSVAQIVHRSPLWNRTMYTSPENMDFVDANPLATCTSGGNSRVVMMVANQSLPEDVIPIFQIHVHGSHRPDLDQFLVQPTKQGWGTSSVIRFTTPTHQTWTKSLKTFLSSWQQEMD